MSARTTRRGLTLIELVLALALLSVLLVAVFTLIDRSLSMWRNGETRRSLLETSAGVQELLADDLRSLEPGARGDLLLDWVRFDTDGDGAGDAAWPRLRLVRQASGGDVQRVRAQSAPPLDPQQVDGPLELALDQPALIEVLWMVAPASYKDKQARAEGVIWRGERVVGDETTSSFFEPGFFGTSNRPPAGATVEVTGGCLWFSVLCATQTSVVHEGWRLGATPECVATSWDAWSRARPETSEHPFNEPAAALPKVPDRVVLPRRVRVELEFERPVDRLRRTFLAAPMETGDSALLVDDGERLPRGPDAHVLVDQEWMRILSVDGHTAAVQRGQRGTRATLHDRNAMVHHGERLVREVVVATYREDWDLR